MILNLTLKNTKCFNQLNENHYFMYFLLKIRYNKICLLKMKLIAKMLNYSQDNYNN